MSKPKTRETKITIGIRHLTKRRIDTLCFNLDMARGEIVDMVVAGIPPIKKKLSAKQRRWMKMYAIRKARRLLMEHKIV